MIGVMGSSPRDWFHTPPYSRSSPSTLRQASSAPALLALAIIDGGQNQDRESECAKTGENDGDRAHQCTSGNEIRSCLPSISIW